MQLRALVLLLGVLTIGGYTAGCDGIPQPPAGGELLLGDSAIPTPPRDARIPDDAAPPDAGPPIDPLLNSIFPNSGPIEGGTRVRLVGREFTADVQVRLGQEDCLDLVFENENLLRCTVPAVDGPTAVNVEVRWPDGRAPSILADGYAYYVPVSITGLNPATGPSAGGARVELEGTGFVDPTAVWFGNTRARRVTWVDENHIVATAPEGDPATVEVSVENANGTAALPEAFTYVESLVVDDLDPRWGRTTGGDAVVLRGAGLRDDTVVRFGDGVATDGVSALGRARLTVNTPAQPAGVSTLRVENANGALTLTDAFLFVSDEPGPFGIVGVAPRRVSNAGSGRFVVGGNGFTEATLVRLGETAAGCTFQNPQVLTCTAPPLPAGPYDVSVNDGDQRAVLPSGLYLFEAVDLFDVQPPRGAVAGGTLVQVVGQGLHADVAFTFGGAALAIEEVSEDGTHLWARTPPGLAGLVDLVAETPDQRTRLPDAFTYFNPRTRYGGVWGEPIDHALNVTVLNYLSGDPVPEAYVQAQPMGGETLYTGITNADGQVTLSERALEGPLEVTAAAVDYEVYTIDRVTQENVTLYLYPYVFDGGPGGGGGREAPRLQGTVRGLGELEKPLEPGLSLVAFVETTHTSQFNRTALPLPQPVSVLVEDGPFEIFCRAGEMAVIVTAGYVPTTFLNTYRRDGGSSYYALRQSITPLAMGHRRYITISPGQTLTDLEVVIDRPLDREVPVVLDNPSGGVLGAPTVFEARPILNYGAEGYFALDSTIITDSPVMRVPYLPDLRDWEADIGMNWVGVARTESWNPYTMTYHEDRQLEDGVLIGPFVGTPEPVAPLEGGSLGPWREVSWTMHPGVNGPTEPAQANVVSLTMANGLPLWTWVTPGPITELQLPPLPPTVAPGGVIPGDMYLYIEPLIMEGSFNFAEFTYGDLNRRKSSSLRYLLITQ